MRRTKAYALVTFWCDLPDDDNEADTAFENITDAIYDATEKAPGVCDGSTDIRDADTHTERTEPHVILRGTA